MAEITVSNVGGGVSGAPGVGFVPLPLLHGHALSLGVPSAAIHAAAADGIDLKTLLSWVATYGVPIVFYLAQVFGWKLPPLPIPPVPPLPLPKP